MRNELDVIPGDPVVLFLRMQPAWAFVDEIRQFIGAFCITAGVTPEREEQLAIATHELAQNAIKSATSPTIELRLIMDKARGTVAVSLGNTCGAAAQEKLRAHVAALVQHEPLAGYVEAMRADPHAPGGLGLARIRFEAQLELEVALDGDRVVVTASGDLNPAPLRGALASPGVLHV